MKYLNGMGIGFLVLGIGVPLALFYFFKSPHADRHDVQGGPESVVIAAPFVKHEVPAGCKIKQWNTLMILISILFSLIQFFGIRKIRSV